MFPAQDALAVMTDPDRHDENRRHMNPAFSRTGILNLQPLINQHLDHLREKMTRICDDGPIVLYDAMRCMTMDVISQFCFGQSANLKEEDPKGFNAQWLRIFDKDMYVLAEFRYWPFILKLGSMLPMWMYSWLSPDSLNFTDFLNVSFLLKTWRSEPNTFFVSMLLRRYKDTEVNQILPLRAPTRFFSTKSSTVLTTRSLRKP